MEQIGAGGQMTSLIHLVRFGVNGWRIACMPGLADMTKQPGHPGYQRSEDARAVTCPACLKLAGLGRNK